jgi:WD40 repeat protein/serine/threonine protein kinase/Flp pilus assembly protein TadD
MSASHSISCTPPGPPVVPDHELLREVGTGSYGEVWLARSVTGTLRAVKVVYRRNFDHDRPFEREFSGILQFEPVSRTHESQVDILHVGRGTDCFYYVMEVADDVDAGQNIDPVAYQPKTLRTEFLRRGALPVNECVELALSLTTGLEHLHKHGLVHRDIKPSNIIFVKGMPKLADIGLVTRADATRSFVGTEGFFPPEGPGTPQADIYSLGKVLYEICTGMDRQEFPDLPTHLVERPDRERLLELNAVIAKACRPESQHRYQTAREMQGELVLLQTGKSVRRVRNLDRRIRRLSRMGIVAATVGTIMAGAFLFQRAKTTQARRLADENRRLAQESSRSVIRMQSANGTRALEQGDSVQAALWFAENLKLSDPHSAEGDLNRLRLEWILREYPQIEQMFVHEEGVNTASFSRDGKRVVTAGKDDKARVWDAVTGEPITAPLAHEDDVWRASFSPDGRFVLSSGADGTARLWNASTGEPIHVFRHERGVTAASISPSGDRILTASRDGTARIWDPATGEPILPPLTHRAGINRAEWTQDGGRVVTGSSDRTAKVWDAKTGQLLHTMTHLYPVDSIDISADGTRLLTATGHTGGHRASQGWIWDLESGKLLVETPRHVGGLEYARFSPDHRVAVLGSNPVGVHHVATGAPAFTALKQGGIHFLAFSPDGTRVATASDTNGAAYVWDAETGRNLFSPLKHGSWVHHVEFNPEGTRLLTSSDDGMARLWNLVTGSGRTATLPHQASLRSAAFTSGSSRIVTVSTKGTPRIWDPATGKIAAAAMGTPGDGGQSSLSGDGRRLLTAVQDTQSLPEPRALLSILDPTTGERVGPSIVQMGRLVAIAINTDGRYAAAAVDDGRIQVWDVISGEPAGPPLAQNERVQLLQFNPAAEHLMAVPDSDTVTVWNWRTGTRALPPLKHSAAIRHATYSPDGRKIATAGYGEAGRLWDAGTGAAIGVPFKHRGLIQYIAFSPDNRLVVTCGLSPRARVWNATTGEQALPPLEHERDVAHAAFDATGRLLLTSSSDKTARLWDVATGEEVLPRLQHASPVVQANFSADGSSFVTACVDGSAAVWRLPMSEYSNEELIARTRIISGQTSRSDGVFVSEQPAQLRALLQRLGTRNTRQVSPESLLAWHESQASHAEENRSWRAADWHLGKLLASRTDDADLLRRRARARAEFKSWMGAHEDLLSAHRSNPNDLDLRAQLLLVTWKAGESDKTRKLCLQFLEEARGSNKPELMGLAAGYASLIPGLVENYSIALELIQVVTRLEPTNSMNAQRMAWLHFRAGRFDEATEAMRQARSLQPGATNSPYLLYLQALLNSHKGDEKLARRYLSLGNQRLQEAVSDYSEPWHILLSFEILRDEVQAVLAQRQN